jgi:hypothetical protein
MKIDFETSHGKEAIKQYKLFELKLHFRLNEVHLIFLNLTEILINQQKLIIMF